MAPSFPFTGFTSLDDGQLMTFKAKSALVNGTWGLDFVTITDHFLSSKCIIKYVDLLSTYLVHILQKKNRISMSRNYVKGSLQSWDSNKVTVSITAVSDRLLIELKHNVFMPPMPTAR